MPAIYRLVRAVFLPGVCNLRKLEGVEKPWALIRGRSLTETFARGVRYHMNPSFPRDTKLADCLRNMNQVLVVSKRVADFFREKELTGVEYLPVSIVNHKGRVASKDYFVINILAIQDALDVKRSKPTYNKINKIEIDDVEDLVLDPKKLDPAIRLFRLKALYAPMLVEGELAEELKAQKFVGMKIEPLEAFES